MEVFYVMVLVLVAGAVPSHGRTESEGTVFKKTLPHESMNNVTVSSSGFVNYDFLYLVMQWPRSFCNSIKGPCYQQVPTYFTVHGLWPQKNPSGGVIEPIDCTTRGIFGNYPLYNSRQPDQRLVPGLNENWPDLKTSGNNNHCFWVSEYNKHGSCTFGSPNEYFGLTLRMVKQLEGPLSGLSIIPGKPYSPRDIKSAVQQATSKLPRLRCTEVGNSFQLLEIRFCAKRNRNGLYLIDCKLPYRDCPNQMVVLPPASASSSLKWA